MSHHYSLPTSLCREFRFLCQQIKFTFGAVWPSILSLSVLPSIHRMLPILTADTISRSPPPVSFCLFELEENKIIDVFPIRLSTCCRSWIHSLCFEISGRSLPFVSCFFSTDRLLKLIKSVPIASQIYFSKVRFEACRKLDFQLKKFLSECRAKLKTL